MKVSVELPQPIKLNADDTIALFLPDAGGPIISIDGDGSVHFQGNGGGAPIFAINLVELAQNIRTGLL